MAVPEDQRIARNAFSSAPRRAPACEVQSAVAIAPNAPVAMQVLWLGSRGEEALGNNCTIEKQRTEARLASGAEERERHVPRTHYRGWFPPGCLHLFGFTRSVSPLLIWVVALT